jgi:hypothetical protein
LRSPALSPVPGIFSELCLNLFNGISLSHKFQNLIPAFVPGIVHGGDSVTALFLPILRPPPSPLAPGYPLVFFHLRRHFRVSFRQYLEFLLLPALEKL